MVICDVPFCTCISQLHGCHLWDMIKHDKSQLTCKICIANILVYNVPPLGLESPLPTLAGISMTLGYSLVDTLCGDCNRLGEGRVQENINTHKIRSVSLHPWFAPAGRLCTCLRCRCLRHHPLRSWASILSIKEWCLKDYTHNSFNNLL